MPAERQSRQRFKKHYTENSENKTQTAKHAPGEVLLECGPLLSLHVECWKWAKHPFPGGPQSRWPALSSPCDCYLNSILRCLCPRGTTISRAVLSAGGTRAWHLGSPWHVCHVVSGPPLTACVPVASLRTACPYRVQGVTQGCPSSQLPHRPSPPLLHWKSEAFLKNAELAVACLLPPASCRRCSMQMK